MAQAMKAAIQERPRISIIFLMFFVTELRCVVNKKRPLFRGACRLPKRRIGETENREGPLFDVATLLRFTPSPIQCFSLRGSALRRLNEFGETGRIGHRKFRQDLA